MEETKDGSCCTKKACCKIGAALALLLVGGAGGFFAGKSCAVKSAPQTVEAPAN